MARLFDGVDDTLNSVATIDLSGTATLSVACWIWWNAFANDSQIALEFGTGTSQGGFTIQPNNSLGAWRVSTYDAGGTNAAQGTVVRPTAGAWHHMGVTFDRTLASGTAFHAFYFDGSAKTITYNSLLTPTGNFGNLTLWLMSDAGSSLFGTGRLADLAVWTSELSAGNMTSLYNGGLGADARTVALPTLVGYWPLCGVTSPEPALMGVPLTVTSTSTIAHPIPGLCDPTPTLLGAFSM